MQILKINKNDAGQRLDKFLTKAIKGLPASLMYKYIRTKKIKVNRKRCEQKQILQEGDEIQLFIRDEFFGSPEKDDGTLARITPKWIDSIHKVVMNLNDLKKVSPMLVGYELRYLEIEKYYGQHLS